VGCKGGVEISFEIRVERRDEGGANCRGSVGKFGGFPKHLTICVCLWVALSQRFAGCPSDRMDENICKL